MIVDSHVHLWDQALSRAGWLASPGATPIRRPFGLDDYAMASAGLGIGTAIVVTAEQSLAETQRLLGECAESTLVAGIVGWLDLTETLPNVANELLGIRHSVISEPEGWLDRADLRGGLKALAERELVFEILIAPRDLVAVARCADAHPALTIVVDHLGNPPDDLDGRTAWELALRALAGRDNVRLKVSGAGLATDPLLAALGVFGADRLMFGSDWPVSLLTGALADRVETARRLTDTLSTGERERFFGGTARETYGLAS